MNTREFEVSPNAKIWYDRSTEKYYYKEKHWRGYLWFQSSWQLTIFLYDQGLVSDEVGDCLNQLEDFVMGRD